MGTGELNAGDNPAMDWHPMKGGVKIKTHLVTSCYKNRDILWPTGTTICDLGPGNGLLVAILVLL